MKGEGGRRHERKMRLAGGGGPLGEKRPCSFRGFVHFLFCGFVHFAFEKWQTQPVKALLA